MPPLPASAAALATSQFGAIARTQLLRWLSDDEIQGLRAASALTNLERGVYRVTGGARPAEQAAMAAVLRARPDAVVTGPLILGLFGVDGFSTASPFIVLTAPERRLTGVSFRHRTDRHGGDRAHWGELPIVTPTRTLIESAVDWQVGERKLRTAIDSCRAQRLTSSDKLRSCARALSGHVGAEVILDLDRRGVLTPESEPERDLFEVLRTIRPMAQSQARVLAGVRVDAYWEHLRLALEYDGAPWHDSRASSAEDRERERRLAAADVRVVRVDKQDLRQPGLLRARILGWMAERAQQLGVAFDAAG